MPGLIQENQGHSNSGFELDESYITNAAKKVAAPNVDEAEKAAPSRDKWDNQIEFLLSCISMSVGLGNVWRFPFVAYENGGGAFLIPYLVVLIFIGKPLYYMELVLGQFSSSGPVKVWDVVPAVRGVGYGQAIANWSVVTYYVALMAIIIFYCFASFSSELPWSTCLENTTNCIDVHTNVTIFSRSHNPNETISSAEDYFRNEVMHLYPRGLDDGISMPDLKLAGCLLFSWVLIFLVLIKGVKSSGKTAYFTAFFPYVVLVILLVKGATLPGSKEGILFFVTPQWEKLLEPKVWYEAVVQCFFSLGVGFGTIIMLASHNIFSHNVYRDATIISFTDTFTSLLAGCTIFSILGHLAHEMKAESVGDVLKGGGASLAFVSYPDVLARIQWLPQLFSVLLFLMLFTLGIGTVSALTACITTVVCDQFPYFKRWVVVLVISTAGFLLGLFYVTPQGMYILDLVDHYGGTFIVYVLAILEVTAVNWIYGYRNFTRDIKFMLNIKTGPYWAFCWVFFMPLLLLGVLVYSSISQEALKSGDYVYGTGANAFGFTIVAIAVSLVPILFLRAVISRKDSRTSWPQALRAVFKPNKNWCPKDPLLRQQYRESLNLEKDSAGGIDNPALAGDVTEVVKS